MLLELLSAFQIAHTQPKVEIIWGKSNEQIRQEQEVIDRGTSYTGNGSVEIIGESNEECVIYARRITGNNKIHGYAGNLQPEGQEPKVGSVALERGHVSVVVAILDDEIIINDANYIKHKITKRKVPKSSIRGYIY